MELEIVQKLTWIEFTLAALLVTVVIEAITILFRFGFNMRANSDLAFLSYWTGGLRIHHLKLGLLLCMVAFATGTAPYWHNTMIIVGSALVVSDVTHHFLVLWPLTGSHEFNLTYPER